MAGQSQMGSDVQLTSHAQLDHSEIELADRETRGGVEEPDLGFKDLDPNGEVTNVYVGKRNFIHQLMDVALMMANVSQLKALLSLPAGDKYYHLIFVFIVMSITLQVVFTLCMLVIWSLEKKIEDHLKEKTKKLHPKDDRRKKIADYLDRLGNVLVLMIIVSNVFITGFGVESHNDPPGPVGTPAPGPGVQHVNNTLR